MVLLTQSKVVLAWAGHSLTAPCRLPCPSTVKSHHREMLKGIKWQNRIVMRSIFCGQHLGQEDPAGPEPSPVERAPCQLLEAPPVSFPCHF